jgi:hypothetical protein
LNDLVLGLYECDVVSFLNRVEILVSLLSIDSAYQFAESSGVFGIFKDMLLDPELVNDDEKILKVVSVVDLYGRLAEKSVC